MMMPEWWYEAMAAIEEYVDAQFLCPVEVLWEDIYYLPTPDGRRHMTVIPVLSMDGDADRMEAEYHGSILELLREEAKRQAKEGASSEGA